MVTVHYKVETFGLAAFPASERLLLRFVPSTTAVSDGALLPLREVRVEVPASGVGTVELAPTTGLTPACWYTVRFEWFDRNPVTAEGAVGWSELPGRVHVPSEGGDLGDMIGDYQAGTIPAFYGFGAPPEWLPSGGIYFDLDSPVGVDFYTDQDGTV